MTAACTCGQRHTTWTNDKDVSNEGHSVACPANPQFAKPSAATSQGSAASRLRRWWFNFGVRYRCRCLYPWTPPCEFCKVRHGR